MPIPRGNQNEFHEYLEEHFHSAQRAYPIGADPIQLTSGVGAWTLSDFFQIVPASIITNEFDIHWVIMSSPDTNEDYEVVLYYGDSDTECGRFSFTRTAAFTGSLSGPMMTPVIPANSKIRAKMMDGAGGAIAYIKILYHEYD